MSLANPPTTNGRPRGSPLRIRFILLDKHYYFSPKKEHFFLLSYLFFIPLVIFHMNASHKNFNLLYPLVEIKFQKIAFYFKQKN